MRFLLFISILYSLSSSLLWSAPLSDEELQHLNAPARQMIYRLRAQVSRRRNALEGVTEAEQSKASYFDRFGPRRSHHRANLTAQEEREIERHLQRQHQILQEQDEAAQQAQTRIEGQIILARGSKYYEDPTFRAEIERLNQRNATITDNHEREYRRAITSTQRATSPFGIRGLSFAVPRSQADLSENTLPPDQRYGATANEFVTEEDREYEGRERVRERARMEVVEDEGRVDALLTATRNRCENVYNMIRDMFRSRSRAGHARKRNLERLTRRLNQSGSNTDLVNANTALEVSVDRVTRARQVLGQGACDGSPRYSERLNSWLARYDQIHNNLIAAIASHSLSELQTAGILIGRNGRERSDVQDNSARREQVLREIYYRTPEGSGSRGGRQGGQE